MILKDENLNHYLDETATRKIVLVIYLFIRLNSKIFYVNFDQLQELEDILIEFEDKSWSSLFLNNDLGCIKIAEALNKLLTMRAYENWEEYSVYALETLEYTPELFINTEVYKGTHVIGGKKKKQGIYYTPNDIVKFMVNQCEYNISNQVKKVYLDCSCGAGIYLLEILHNFLVGNSTLAIHDILSFIKESVWGIDISEIAVDTCKIIFFCEVLQYVGNYNCEEIWNAVEQSFYIGDSTKLGEVINTYRLPQKYTCIIGNPPYISLKGKNNIYLKFLEHLMDYTEEGGCSSLIVPLSICYSSASAFKNCREKILNDKEGEWFFYNFDRSPDSLFGDQVKTRNTIVVRKSSDKFKMWSTGLKRWTFQTRNILFENLYPVCLRKISIFEYIPKLNSVLEFEAFRKLKVEIEKQENLIHINQKEKNIFLISGTAYNWISVYDHYPKSIDENGNEYLSPSVASQSFLKIY